jgi:hypothetical protein
VTVGFTVAHRRAGWQVEVADVLSVGLWTTPSLLALGPSLTLVR